MIAEFQENGQPVLSKDHTTHIQMVKEGGKGS